MSDGFTETGEELLMHIKQSGLADHDADAVRAIEDVVKAILTEASGWRIKPERKLRRVYMAGVFSGIKIMATMSRLKLEQMRFEEGKDPKTGEPVTGEN